MKKSSKTLRNVKDHTRDMSLIKKRSLVIGGHRTSVSLEDEFWSVLKSIAGKWKLNLSQVVGKIDSERSNSNLSSALRLFVLGYLQKQIERCETTCNASKLHQHTD